jgi:hypothetical protein
MSDVDSSSPELVIRGLADAHGGRVSGTLSNVLARFGYEQLTPEARAVVEDRLAAVGLSAVPSLRDRSLKLGSSISLWTDAALDARDERDASERVAVSPVGVGVALAGALAMLIALFLPYADNSTEFARIVKNSVIQAGGWPLILIAVGVAVAAYHAHSEKRKGWAVIVLGLVAVGIAVWLGTNKSNLTVYPIDPSTGQPDPTASGTVVDPGIGVWVAGVGGALAVLGGWMIRQSPPIPTPVDPPDPSVEAAEPQTKKCPDCAEIVLADARVCKHCHYRFAEAPSSLS